MPDLKPLSNIASATDITNLNNQLSALNDTMLYFITAMLDKMPRLDANDRMLVNLTDMTNTLGTVTTVSTVTTVTNMTNLNNFSGGNANFAPYHFSDSAVCRIYNNIQVT